VRTDKTDKQIKFKKGYLNLVVLQDAVVQKDRLEQSYVEGKDAAESQVELLLGNVGGRHLRVQIQALVDSTLDGALETGEDRHAQRLVGVLGVAHFKVVNVAQSVGQRLVLLERERVECSLNNLCVFYFLL